MDDMKTPRAKRKKAEPGGGWVYHGGGIMSKWHARHKREVFYVQVYYQGRRYTEKGGATHRQAQKKLGQLHREIDDGTYVPPKVRKELDAEERRKQQLAQAKRMTFEEFGKKYINANRKTWTSSLWHEDRIRILNRVFKDLYLDEIDRKSLQRYRDKRAEQVKASTVNQEIRYLRTLFNFAVLEGEIPQNPASRVRLLPDDDTPDKRVRVLNAEQRKAQIEAADPEFQPALRFAYLTGARWAETAKLTWSCVDFELRTITIEDRKTGRTRKVRRRVNRMNDSLYLLLRARELACDDTGPDARVFLWQGRPLITFDGEKGRRFGRYYKPWYAASKAAELEDFDPYDTRHTYITEALSRGLAPWKVAKQVGTSVQQIEKTYGHWIREDQDEIARAMNGVAG